MHPRLLENLDALVCFVPGFYSGIRYLNTRKALYADMICYGAQAHILEPLTASLP